MTNESKSSSGGVENSQGGDKENRCVRERGIFYAYL